MDYRFTFIHKMRPAGYTYEDKNGNKLTPQMPHYNMVNAMFQIGRIDTTATTVYRVKPDGTRQKPRDLIGLNGGAFGSSRFFIVGWVDE